MNGHVSAVQNFPVSVPQGSILGPLLFLINIIYTNGLLKAAPILSYILFADDTQNIFSTFHKILQNETINIENWCISDK